MKLFLSVLVFISASSWAEGCLDNLKVGLPALVDSPTDLVIALGRIEQLGPDCVAYYRRCAKGCFHYQIDASKLLRLNQCDSKGRVCVGQSVAVDSEVIKVEWVLSNQTIGYEKCTWWGYCSPKYYRVDQVFSLSHRCR